MAYSFNLDHEPNKLELGKLLGESHHDMTEYQKKGGKIGGAMGGGDLGGRYDIWYRIRTADHSRVKKQTVLFKQDTNKDGTINHDKNIAEFVAGHIMNELIGDSAASVFLATAPSVNGVKIPDDSGNNIFIGSVYYDQYNDLFTQLYADQGKDLPKTRPRMVGILPGRTDVMRKGMYDAKTKKCAYEDFPAVTIASAIVGDFDVHWGNYGTTTMNDATGNAVKDSQGMPKRRLVKIDHGAALDSLDDDLHLHSHSRHTPFTFDILRLKIKTRPTNHIREYPRALKVSPEFAAKLDEIAGHDTEKMRACINNALDEAGKFYGPKPLADFARLTGIDIDRIIGKPDWKTMNDRAKQEMKDAIITSTKAYLFNKLQSRMQSCKQLSTDIKMSLCIAKKAGTFSFDSSLYDINNIVRNDPLYFLRGQFHFRKADQRTVFGIIKTKLFTKPTLNALMLSRVDSLLDVIINDAAANKNPAVIEQLLLSEHNRKLVEVNDPGLKKLKQAYQTILKNIHSDIKNENPEKLTSRVIAEILTEKSIANRTLLLERWITIMAITARHGDHAAALAISNALHDPCIKRLTVTFNGISENARNYFATTKTPAQTLVSSTANSILSESIETQNSKISPYHLQKTGFADFIMTAKSATLKTVSQFFGTVHTAAPIHTSPRAKNKPVKVSNESIFMHEKKKEQPAGSPSPAKKRKLF